MKKTNLVFIVSVTIISLCWLVFCSVLIMAGLSDTAPKKDVPIEFIIFNFPIISLTLLNFFKLNKVKQRFSFGIMAIVLVLNLAIGSYQNHWKRWNTSVEQKYEIVGRSVYFASHRKPKIDADTFIKVPTDKPFSEYKTFLYQDKDYLYIGGETLKDIPRSSFTYHTPYYFSLGDSLYYLPRGNESKYDFSKKMQVLSDGASDVEFFGASCLKNGQQHFIGNKKVELPSDFRWLKNDRFYSCHYGVSSGKIWSFKFKEGHWRSRHPKIKTYLYAGDLETTTLISKDGKLQDKENSFELDLLNGLYEIVPQT